MFDASGQARFVMEVPGIVSTVTELSAREGASLKSARTDLARFMDGFGTGASGKTEQAACQSEILSRIRKHKECIDRYRRLGGSSVV